MDAGRAGGYRYYRDPSLGPEYEAAMDALFDTYSAAIPRVTAWAAEQFPRGEGEPEAAHARAIKAKALDLLRGLLPAASLSHMGIFATGQAYEQLILHLLAHPLPEAQRYGADAAGAVQATIPSFVTRVERPDRGGAGSTTCARARTPGARGRRGSGLDARTRRREAGPSVRLLRAEGSEDDLIAALLFEASGVPEERRSRAAAGLDGEQRAALLRDLIGDAREPPPPARPRLRGAALPLRDRLRLRRLPRPPAPPHADRASGRR